MHSKTATTCSILNMACLLTAPKITAPIIGPDLVYTGIAQNARRFSFEINNLCSTRVIQQSLRANKSWNNLDGKRPFFLDLGGAFDSRRPVYVSMPTD